MIRRPWEPAWWATPRADALAAITADGATIFAPVDDLVPLGADADTDRLRRTWAAVEQWIGPDGLHVRASIVEADLTVVEAERAAAPHAPFTVVVEHDGTAVRTLRAYYDPSEVPS